MKTLIESDLDLNTFLDQVTSVEIRRSNGQRLAVAVQQPAKSLLTFQHPVGMFPLTKSWRQFAKAVKSVVIGTTS